MFEKLRKIFSDDEVPFDYVAVKMEQLNRELGIIK